MTAVLFALTLLGAAACSRAEEAADIVNRIAVEYTKGPTATYPSIEPIAGSPAVADATLSWMFEGVEVTIAVPIDGDVLAGARAAKKHASIPPDWTPEQWQPDYYRAFVDDPALDDLYGDMLVSLRAIRDERGLDGDRYAELITTMAQSIEYFTDGSPPKFPIETVADGAGDCDDKAILAAALLAREGYDVSLLGFSEENHMSLGLASNGSTYRSSGYSFVEMTTESLVGWYNRDDGVQSADGTKLDSEPAVITVGIGSLFYTVGPQTDAIRDAFDTSRARVDALDPQLEGAQAQYEAVNAELTAIRAEMDARQEAGDIQGYNLMVDEHNATLARYNRAVDAYNALVAEQRAAAERANRINGNQGDRLGLARWLGL